MRVLQQTHRRDVRGWQQVRSEGTARGSQLAVGSPPALRTAGGNDEARTVLGALFYADPWSAVLGSELADHGGELVHGGVEDVLHRLDRTDAPGDLTAERYEGVHVASEVEVQRIPGFQQ